MDALLFLILIKKKYAWVGKYRLMSPMRQFEGRVRRTGDAR